jgi:hypothetical protein
MKTNELRIGNLVNYNNLANSVRGIDETYIELFDNTYAYIDNIEPIPLTEDWLIKFGFEIKRDGEFLQADLCIRDEFYLCCYDLTDSFDISYQYRNDDGIDSIPVLMDLQFVHELQNLYFALTGKELKIK